MLEQKRFAIALSFPGEHRRFVKNVVDRLAEVLGKERVFYDEWYEAELAGLDGDLKLRRYYRKLSEMVVPFFSEHYEKDWCQIEWSAIRAMLKDRRKEDVVIPIQLDGTKVEGWEDIDFAIRKKNRSGKQIADLIIQAYRLRSETGASQKDGQTSKSSDSLAIDISRIVKYAPAELIGRETETALLNNAWEQVQNHKPGRPHVLAFVALGGEGKTSLVAKWVAELAARDWPGCDAVFAWSFYSQGSREQVAVSSDLFLNEALTFFGDAEMAASAQGAFEKGKRLAQLTGERKVLLILDGLEPLQYAPTSPTRGLLNDQGISALLTGLATNSSGLCVITTRYDVADLQPWSQSTAVQHELLRLSTQAGVALLRSMKSGAEKNPVQIRGSEAEFEALVEDVDGHALTLQIIGQLLLRAHRGDIRRRDRIEFGAAEQKIPGGQGLRSGHAFRAMAAYQTWLEEDSDESRRELAVLKLLGLFDRPAIADCVEALLKQPAIDGLTEPLIGLVEDDWEFTLTGLENARLITVNRDGLNGNVLSLDAHPLLREYFAHHLREGQPETWKAAHRRVYEHLCETTEEGNQPTLEDLQPLYQAVAHGCRAGLQQEACDKVYHARIRRGNEAYSDRKLGAFGSDLGAVACFFETPWSRVSSALTEADQACSRIRPARLGPADRGH